MNKRNISIIFLILLSISLDLLNVTFHIGLLFDHTTISFAFFSEIILIFLIFRAGRQGGISLIINFSMCIIMIVVLISEFGVTIGNVTLGYFVWHLLTTVIK